MGARMKYLNVRNPHFSSGIKKLGAFENFSQQGRYRTLKLIEWVEKEEKTAQRLWVELINKYAEKDAEGKLLSPDGAPAGSFRVPDENREAFEKGGLEWADLEIEFTTALPIGRDDVNRCGLSPLQEKALEGFIEPLSEETPEAL